MQFADTHTHLYLPEFDSDRDVVISSALKNGVSKLLLPNIDDASEKLMMEMVEKYPGVCYPMVGLHPTSVKGNYLSQLGILERSVSEYKFIAVGETGIDLYWDKTYLQEQIISFRRHVELSLSLELPLVIHSRESFSEIFSVLEEFKGYNLKGVFHAFTGDAEIARRAIAMGFKLGIGGIVTFKNSGLDRVVKEIGPEHIVLETDSPYLAPVPHRGKRNESAYITIINSRLSGIFEMTADETASIFYRNSAELFKF